MDIATLLEGTSFTERLDFIGAVAKQLRKELQAPIWAGQPEEEWLDAAAKDLAPLEDILITAKGHCQTAAQEADKIRPNL